jgi:hypothetical protein
MSDLDTLLWMQDFQAVPMLSNLFFNFLNFQLHKPPGGDFQIYILSHLFSFQVIYAGKEISVQICWGNLKSPLFIRLGSLGFNEP